MHPPALLPLPGDIGTYWSDEELCMCLQRMMNGSPLPNNVLDYVNPYHCRPSNLPDGIWYLIRSGGESDVESGFWKAKGEMCKIFTSSVIIGWRKTFEFYEGKSPHGHKTDWVMQVYSISEKEPSRNKKSKGLPSSLCRVFHSEGSDSSVGNQIPSQLSEQGSTSNSQVNSGPLTTTERDCLSRGDFIELLDLADPNSSPSSSSDNSSCVTLSSDECFDALELQDLEPENNQHPCCKSTISPDKVVLPPPDLGSLTTGSRNNSPPSKQIPNSHHFAPNSVTVVDVSPKYKVETSKEAGKNISAMKTHIVAESSNRASLPSDEEKKAAIIKKKKLDEEKKAAIIKKKKLKNYFCFFPYLAYL